MTTFDEGLIDDIIEFYRNWMKDELARFAQRYPNEVDSFEVPYAKLQKANQDLAEDYLDHPELVHEYLSEALSLVELPWQIDLSEAEARVVDFEGPGSDYITFDVGDYSPTSIAGESAIVRGQVAKRTKTRPLPTKAVWECERCGNVMEIEQTKDSELQEPYECHSCDRQGPFIPRANEMAREHGVDYQQIRLQRPPEKSQSAEEETLDVELQGDLVKTVEPGDRVAILSDIRALVNDGNSPELDIRAEAQSIQGLETDFEDIDFEEYRHEIEEIANGDDPYQKIIDSISPGHFGDERIKEAIAYQLFGGVAKDLPDNSEIRGSIHIFLIGDPGVGKSSLLQYVNKLAPRSIYTSGTGSTAAGLTAAATKDDFGDGGWTLKGGALVEAHNGVCCIDELDDMAEEDRSGMLEAMSDQQISVSKAGMNTTLPAKTTVLAAANPSLGRFDPNTKITDQLDIHPALLSRFDLIFALRDQPDESHDADVAEHMTTGARVGQQRARDGSAGEDSQAVEPALDPELMRAYIALARQYNPVFAEEAEQRIQNEYVAFRQANEDESTITTTARMIESLTRLSEAAARIRLSETVAVKDVERAISIYHEYLGSFGIDPETDEFDVDVIETGTSQTQRDRVRSVSKVIESLCEEYDRGAPKESVVDHPTLSDMDDDKIEHEIDQLKDKGELYEPSNGRLRTT